MMKLLVLFLAVSRVPAESIHEVHLQYAFKGQTRQIAKRFDLRMQDAEASRIFLFDSTDVGLFHRNVQVRLRFSSDKAQLAVKQWGLSQSEFEDLQARLGGCEIDVHGSMMIRSCQAKVTISADAADRILAGESVLSAMSPSQIYIVSHAQVPFTFFKEVIPLGPISSTGWSWRRSDSREYGIDIQETPDGREFRELSVRTRTERHLEEWRRVGIDLDRLGLDLSRRQHGRRLEKLSILIGCARLLTSADDFSGAVSLRRSQERNPSARSLNRCVRSASIPRI